MKEQDSSSQFVVCIENDSYPASLELRKIYRLVADAHATEHGQLRVIDESGEDYIYPASFFVPIELPKAVEIAFS